MLMIKGAAAEEWIKAAEELPDEGTTVLVHLDCGAVTLGPHLEGKWETAVAPYDSSIRDDADVLFWRRLPWPSAETLTPSDAVVAGACCCSQAAKVDVRARFGTDGTKDENLAGGSVGGDLAGRPELTSTDGSRVMTVSDASALRSPVLLENVITVRRAVEHSFSTGSDDLFAGYPEASSVRCFDASFIDYDLSDLGAQADAVDSYDEFEAFLVNLLRSSQVNRSRYRDAPVCLSSRRYCGAWKNSIITSTGGRRRSPAGRRGNSSDSYYSSPCSATRLRRTGGWKMLLLSVPI
jgi:hypothetical protein